MLLQGLQRTKKRRWEMRCLYNFRALQWASYWEGYPHEICDSLIHHFLNCFPILNILCDKEFITFKLSNSKSCSTHKVLFILKSILDHLFNHLPHTHSLKNTGNVVAINRVYVYSEAVELKKQAFGQWRRESWPTVLASPSKLASAGQAVQMVGRSWRKGDWKRYACRWMTLCFRPPRS